MSEELYELLKQKDALIARYAELVGALRNTVVQAMAEHAESEAWTSASAHLDQVFYEHGFRSNGDPR